MGSAHFPNLSSKSTLPTPSTLAIKQWVWRPAWVFTLTLSIVIIIFIIIFIIIIITIIIIIIVIFSESTDLQCCVLVSGPFATKAQGTFECTRQLEPNKFP